MNARDYLEQIVLLDAQINGAIADMQRWYDRATSITAQPKTIVSFDEQTGKITKTVAPASFGGGISDKVGDSVAEYVDIELDADIKGLLRQRQSIIDNLRKLKNEDQFTVLNMAFVLNMTNKEIAQSIDRSLTWVSTTKTDGIKALQEIIKDRG